MKPAGIITLLFFIIVIPAKAQELETTEETVQIEKTEQSGQAEQIQTEQPEQIKDAQLQDPVSEDQLKPHKKKIEIELKTITIKGKKKPSQIKRIEKAITATEITAKDIEVRSDKLLKDVLYQVPGMQISKERKGTTRFSMRGYDMSKIALLIDGIPVIDAFGGGIDIDNIGLMNISQVIVSRGTCSALYGARGTAGSINLIKKEPTELYAKLTAEYGQHRNYVIGAANGAPIGNFYYDFSAVYDKLRGYTVSKRLNRTEREKWLLKLSRYDLYGFSLNSTIYGQPASSSADNYLNDTGLWDHTNHEKYKINGKAGYHITPSLETGISAFYNYSEMENSTYYADMTSMYTYNGTVMQWQQPDTSHILGNISSRWPEYYDYAVAPYVKYNHGKFDLRGNIYFYEQSNIFAAYADPQEVVLAYNRDPETMTWSIWTSRCYGLNFYPSYKLQPWNKLNFALSFYTATHREEEKAYNGESIEVIDDYGTGKYETQYVEADYITIAIEEEIYLPYNIELTLGMSYDAQNLVKFQEKNGIDGSTEMIDRPLAEDDSTIWGTKDSFNPVAGIVYEPFQDFLKLRAAGSRKTSFPALRYYTKTENYYMESEGIKDAELKPEKSINLNTGFELSFLDKHLTWGTDYFFSKYNDKIIRIYISRIDSFIYRNIDSMSMHGAESILNANFVNVLNLADIDVSFTYTFIFARNSSNQQNSFINKGDRVENLPEHKFTFDLRTNFKTGTSLIIFGYFEYNQVKYVMSSRPSAVDDFSTSYYYAARLHDPLMIDIKLNQKLYDNYEVYVMCRNIMDDYNADPFNPGPGRTFYLGAKAEL